MKSFRQETNYTCGVACLRSLLDAAGLKVPSERTLARKLCANKVRGTEPWRIEQFLYQSGVPAKYVKNETFARLRCHLASGWWAIVCWADWGGHYCIVDRIEDESGWSGGRISLIDPASFYENRSGWTEVSVDRFKVLWFNPIDGNKQEVIYVKKHART